MFTSSFVLGTFLGGLIMASTGKEVSQLEFVSGQSNKALSRPAHCLSSEAAIAELGTHPEEGLSNEVAHTRYEGYGSNELSGGQAVEPLKILLRQIANAMTLVSLA